MLCSDELRVDVERLIPWMNEARATLSLCPTPLMEAIFRSRVPCLCAMQWREGLCARRCESSKTLRTLRYMFTGGDIVHVRPTAQHTFQLLNFYGPTENTVIASVANIKVRALSGAVCNISTDSLVS